MCCGLDDLFISERNGHFLSAKVIFIFFVCVLLEFEVHGGYITNSSDYVVVKKLNKYFYDTTWFIRDFMNRENRPAPIKMITGPANSGKTTVIDMVKRFINVQVNEAGDPVYTKNCSNYRLFCTEPLIVCWKNNTEFVNRNFGRHPVLHINYRPMRLATDFDSFLQLLQSVIRETFLQHSYISNNTILFLEKESRNQFMKYYEQNDGRNLSMAEISRSFQWLSELMYCHFNNKVVVLFDEYDGFYHSKLYERIDDEADIFNNRSLEYLEGIYTSLFQSNSYLNRALLTGSMLMSDMERFPEHAANIETMDDHPLLIDVWMNNVAGTRVEDVSF